MGLQCTKYIGKRKAMMIKASADAENVKARVAAFDASEKGKKKRRGKKRSDEASI